MQSQLRIFKRDVLRYPRLDTVLMIEDAIRKAKGGFTVREIWKRLLKKVMWQTYLATLDYLEYSGKILIDRDKTVIWIWNPKLLAKVKSEGVEV